MMEQPSSEPEDGEIRDDNDEEEEEENYADSSLQGEYFNRRGAKAKYKNNHGGKPAYPTRKSMARAAAWRRSRNDNQSSSPLAHYSGSQGSVSVSSAFGRGRHFSHSTNRRHNTNSSVQQHKLYERPIILAEGDARKVLDRRRSSGGTSTSSTSRRHRSATRDKDKANKRRISKDVSVSSISSTESGILKKVKSSSHNRNKSKSARRHKSKETLKRISTEARSTNHRRRRDSHSHQSQSRQGKGKENLSTTSSSSHKVSSDGGSSKHKTISTHVHESTKVVAAVHLQTESSSVTSSKTDFKKTVKPVIAEGTSSAFKPIVPEPISDVDSIISIPIVRKSPEIITLDATDTSDDDEEQLNEEDPSQLPSQTEQQQKEAEGVEEIRGPVAADFAPQEATTCQLPPVSSPSNVKSPAAETDTVPETVQNESVEGKSSSNTFEEEEDIEVLEMRNELLADMVERMNTTAIIISKQENCDSQDFSTDKKIAEDQTQSIADDNNTTNNNNNNNSNSAPSVHDENSQQEAVSEDESELLRAVLISQMKMKAQNKEAERPQSHRRMPTERRRPSNPSMSASPASPQSMEDVPPIHRMVVYDRDVPRRRSSSSAERSQRTKSRNYFNRRSRKGPTQHESTTSLDSWSRDGGSRSRRQSLDAHPTRAARSRKSKQYDKSRDRKNDSRGSNGENLEVTRFVRIKSDELELTVDDPYEIPTTKEVRKLPEDDLRMKLIRSANLRKAITSPQSSPGSSRFELREFGIMDTDLRQRHSSNPEIDTSAGRTVTFQKNGPVITVIQTSTKAIEPLSINIPTPGIIPPEQTVTFLPRIPRAEYYDPQTCASRHANEASPGGYGQQSQTAGATHLNQGDLIIMPDQSQSSSGGNPAVQLPLQIINNVLPHQPIFGELPVWRDNLAHTIPNPSQPSSGSPFPIFPVQFTDGCGNMDVDHRIIPLAAVHGNGSPMQMLGFQLAQSSSTKTEGLVAISNLYNADSPATCSISALSQQQHNTQAGMEELAKTAADIGQAASTSTLQYMSCLSVPILSPANLTSLGYPTGLAGHSPPQQQQLQGMFQHGATGFGHVSPNVPSSPRSNNNNSARPEPIPPLQVSPSTEQDVVKENCELPPSGSPVGPVPLVQSKSEERQLMSAYTTGMENSSLAPTTTTTTTSPTVTVSSRDSSVTITSESPGGGLINAGGVGPAVSTMQHSSPAAKLDVCPGTPFTSSTSDETVKMDLEDAVSKRKSQQAKTIIIEANNNPIIPMGTEAGSDSVLTSTPIAGGQVPITPFIVEGISPICPSEVNTSPLVNTGPSSPSPTSGHSSDSRKDPSSPFSGSEESQPNSPSSPGAKPAAARSGASISPRNITPKQKSNASPLLSQVHKNALTRKATNPPTSAVPRHQPPSKKAKPASVDIIKRIVPAAHSPNSWSSLPNTMERIVIPITENDTSTSEDEEASSNLSIASLGSTFQQSLDEFLKKVRYASEHKSTLLGNPAATNSKPNINASPLVRFSITDMVENGFISSSPTISWKEGGSSQDSGNSSMNTNNNNNHNDTALKVSCGKADVPKPASDSSAEKRLRTLSPVATKKALAENCSVGSPVSDKKSILQDTTATSKTSPVPVSQSKQIAPEKQPQKKDAAARPPGKADSVLAITGEPLAAATSSTSSATGSVVATPTNESRTVELKRKISPTTGTGKVGMGSELVPLRSKTPNERSSAQATTSKAVSQQEASKAIINELVKKITESRDQLALSNAEKNLINSRQTCITEIRSIKSNLQKHLQFVNLETNCENEISSLERKLALLKSRRDILSGKAAELNKTIKVQTKKVFPERVRCITLAKAVREMGQKVVGKLYRVPDVYLKELQEISKDLQTLDKREPKRYQDARGPAFQRLIGNTAANSDFNKRKVVPVLGVPTPPAPGSTSESRPTAKVVSTGKSVGVPSTSTAKSGPNQLQETSASSSASSSTKVPPAQIQIRGKIIRRTSDPRDASDFPNAPKPDSQIAPTVIKPVTDNAVSNQLESRSGLPMEVAEEQEGVFRFLTRCTSPDVGNRGRQKTVNEAIFLTSNGSAPSTFNVFSSELSLECLKQSRARKTTKQTAMDPNKEVCPDKLLRGICTRKNCPLQHI